MNRIFTLIMMAILMPLFILSQAQRVVLIEEGSNASCGPCAAANPGFHALTTPFETANEVVVLKYQWYFPGFDPMHNHNVAEANARVSYYSQNGVPFGVLDGNVFVDHIASFTGSMISNRVSVPSPFEIDIDAQMDTSFTEINVDVDVTAAMDYSAPNLKLRIAVIEKHIHFETAPGSNGETDFYNIMKKFLPGSGGIDLDDSFTSGMSQSFSESWTHANVYSIPELAVVAFIQDDATKEVLQAGMVDVSFTVAEDDAAATVDARSSAADYYNNQLCDFTVVPKVRLSNQGNNSLTSCDITYKVNDGQTHSYTWSSSQQNGIPTLGTREIDLPAVAYFKQDTNYLYVTISNPNGQVDPDTTDNVIVTEFYPADELSGNLKFDFSHDEYGSEATWTLKNSAGTVLYSGGPYPDAIGSISETFSLTNSDCYTLNVNDSYGDGQIGNATGVTFTDMDNSNEVILNYSDYGSGFKYTFGVESEQSSLVRDSSDVYGDTTVVDPGDTTSIKNPNVLENLHIYPNPANNYIMVSVEKTTKATALSISLVDVLGRILIEKEVAKSESKLNTSNLQPGIYFINIKEKGKTVAISSVVIDR